MYSQYSNNITKKENKKNIWNCHNESPLYNEYMPIKMKKNSIPVGSYA
jgi:hypothetical protein